MYFVASHPRTTTSNSRRTEPSTLQRSVPASTMYHPTRGGARGGAAEFSWDKVKESKDREFYLGNSVAAPTGRWQDGRDINWYNKDSSTSSASAAADERREELRRIKEAETAALYAKLGRPPPGSSAAVGEVKVGERLASGSKGSVRRETTGANSAPLDVSKSKWGTGSEEVSEADKKLARKFARDEVRRRRADRDGVDDDEGKRRRKEEDRHYDSSSRRRDDDESKGRHHRHRHHHHVGSRRHRDDLQDRESSGRHRRHSHSRSRSRSPDPSIRHRQRERHHSRPRHEDADADSRRRPDSPSRQDREHRDEGSKSPSPSRHSQNSPRERPRHTFRQR